MSSPDDFTPRFDDIDNETTREDDIYAPARVKPTKTSKKKSKTAAKKSKKYVDTFVEPEEEEEDTPFARTIAPLSPSVPSAPPPTEFYGVSLDNDDFPPDHTALGESSAPSSPPLQAAQHDVPPEIDDEPPPLPSPVSSPAAWSPQPLPARPAPVSSSPAARQAAIYGSPPPYSSPRNHRVPSLSGAQAQPRRDFLPQHASPRSQFVEPASAPHKAQPHFFGLPDLDFLSGTKKEQNPGKTAGSDGYCCCFDSFADSGDDASSRKAKDALLVGSEGGLEVFRILPNKLEVVGRLEGLRGSVVGAKILPHTELYDHLQPIRPLVAVIVHGVMVEDIPDSSIRKDGSQNRALKESTCYYQTTVEVYSLQTQQHVVTLYKSSPVAVEQPTIGQPTSLPEPIGDLRITAQSRFIILASGKSGEVFVFANAVTSTYPAGNFRCIGKFWTSLQSPLDTPSSRPPSSSENSRMAEDGDEKPGVPLCSLSQRWLAIVAPSISSHVSIHGSPALGEHNPNPPGLASAVAPPQPPVTCDIAGVDAEDTWSRLTRQAAKGVVKYSQKGIDLGWQGWRELTNPTPQSAQQHGRTSSKDHDVLFPPTNAPPDDPKQKPREPAIVSIIDLVALLEAEETKPKYQPAPLATFALREGCNFLSFSMSGLRLLTVSRKGDVSIVWDLSRSCHGSQRLRDGPRQSSSANGPCVKQVHRIARNSPSLVVDCAWARDDEDIGLLTSHGTIHLHEVPMRSSLRKRKRRNTTSAPVPEKAQPTVGVSHGSSPPSSNGGFLGSIKSGWQQMSSQVNSLRSQNPVATFSIPTTFAGFKEATANASHAGGRVLAKGLSQGLSVAKGGASDYWHADDNKIRHKALQGQDGTGSLKWIKRQSDTLLAVVCGGTVHLHPVQRLARRKGDVMVSGLKADRYGKKQFALPSIRTHTSNDAANGAPHTKKGREDESCTKQGPHGFWSLRVSPEANDLRRPTSGSGLSQANEVETNPPYCPFHIDSRVDIFAFDDDMRNSADSTGFQGSIFHIHGHGSATPTNPSWLFGEPLPAATKMNTHDDIDIHRDGEPDDSDMDVDSLAEQMESTLTVRTAGGEGGREEILINTWRAQPARPEAGDGGFDAWVDEDDSGSGE